MTARVSVIVVAYNSADLIGPCLHRLATSEIDHEVIVVDNASADRSADLVEAEFPKATVVRLPANVGFANAVNAGAARATTPWLLLLNPDTEPVGDLLAALVAAGDASSLDILAGRTLRADHSDDGRSVFAEPSLWSLFCFASGLSTAIRTSRITNPEELPALDRTRPAVVPAASGCVLLIRRSRWVELGGFTPDYFMYSEDLDLCMRAGNGVQLVPQAQVVHVGGASSTSAGKLGMLLRGKTTYMRLRWPRRRAALGRTLLTAGVGLRAAGSAVTGHAGMWRTVWRDRRTWLAGWPKP